MKRIIYIVALLVILAGSLFSQTKVFRHTPAVITVDGDTVPISLELVKKAQVTEQEVEYPSGTAQQYPSTLNKELSQDSLISYTVSLQQSIACLAELSTTPSKITNYNENTIHFVYEDSLLAEEVVKILSEILPQTMEHRKAIADNLSHEIGMSINYIAGALWRTKKREAKAHLVIWPILLGLSLALLILGVISERKILQYTGALLFVVSLVAAAVYLPEMWALSTSNPHFIGTTVGPGI